MALLRPPTKPIQPRFQELFRLRKGGENGTAKGKGGYKGGDDLDYFRFTTSVDDEAQAAALEAAWNAMQSRTSGWRRIPIRFLGSTIEEVFNGKWNEVWGVDAAGRKRCTRRCDGVTTVLHMKEEQAMKSNRTMKVVCKDPIPCAAEEGMNECPLGCKPTGILRFAITELPSFGMGVLTTHSIYDIEGLKQDLEPFRGQDLRGIPFVLCRKMKDIPWNKPDGNVMMQKKSIVHLEVDPKFGQAQLAGQARQALALAAGEHQVMPMRSAAVQTFRESDEWAWFEGEIAACIGSRDPQRLEQIVESGYEWQRTIRDRSQSDRVRAAIADEHDRALNLLASNVAPAAPTDKAKAIYDRLSALLSREDCQPQQAEAAIAWVQSPDRWQWIKGSAYEADILAMIEVVTAAETAADEAIEAKAEPVTDSELY